MGTDAVLPRIPPPEQRLADRLSARQMPRPMSARAKAVAVLGELGQVDLAVYRAIAGTPTPTLDRPMRRGSDAANWSRLWLAIGGAMAVAGGRPAGGRPGPGSWRSPSTPRSSTSASSWPPAAGGPTATRRACPPSAGCRCRRRRRFHQGTRHPASPSRTPSRIPCPPPRDRWACSPAPSATPASTPECTTPAT
jgi:hypothetical protein